jgi:hypothetical protein
MNTITWIVELAQRGWIDLKFFFRNIAISLQRIAYLARMFKLIRKGQLTKEEFVESIPCLANDPLAIQRWVRELRDLAIYFGYQFDRRIAMSIVKKCQGLFRKGYLDPKCAARRDFNEVKRSLYKLAGRLGSVMTPISISDSANFLLGRMFTAINWTVAGNWEVEEEEE